MALRRWIGMGLGLLLAVASAPVGTARADIPREGTFRADSRCPAVQSIRSGANPGQVALVPGTDYALLAQNRAEASHYLIVVSGAEPPRRWVAKACGRVRTAGDAVPAPAGPPVEHVLAVSWQPGFCALKPRLPECRSQTPHDFTAAHFALHGLWPQAGEYCGVPVELVTTDRRGDWDRLPRVMLDRATRGRLDQVMPGSRSGLDRHEWIRHGTCFTGGQGAYFAASLALLDQLNAAAPRALFADAVGTSLTAGRIRQAFDQAFGPGAGQHVELVCEDHRGQTLIVELRIALGGPVTEESRLSDLIARGPVSGPGCRRGLVDPAGPS